MTGDRAVAYGSACHRDPDTIRAHRRLRSTATTSLAKAGEFRFAPDGKATTVSFSLSADLAGSKKLRLSRSAQSATSSERQALDRDKTFLERS